MIDEQKNTQGEPRTLFEGMPFAAMSQNMAGRQGSGCGCDEMMSRLLTTCGRIQIEEETAITRTTQKA